MRLNKNLYYLCIALSAGIWAMGCGDDGAKKVDQCANGACNAEPVCKGDDCESPEKCTKTEDTCIDEDTVQHCKDGEMPATEKCTSGHCKAGKCETAAEPIDTKCSKTETTCADNVTLSECTEGEEAVLTDCSQTVENGVCSNGACVKQVSGGDNCAEGEACPDGMYCSYTEPHICIAYSKAGESCQDNDCDPKLLCIEGVCLEPVEPGMACNSNTFCQDGQCKDGICQKISEAYGSCGDHETCPEGTICTDGICVPTRGNCQKNDDCMGDTYCCLDAACGSYQGVCIPYSEDKNNDEACLFTTKPGIFEAAIQCGWKMDPSEHEDVEISGPPGYEFPPDEADPKWVYGMVTVGKIHNAQKIDKPMLVFSTESSFDGKVRIVNSETCQTVETLFYASLGYDSPVLADLDGDGYMEIIGTGSNIFDEQWGLYVYSWDESQGKHVQKFVESTIDWDGTLSIHDIDNDGVPEVIDSKGHVARVDGKVLSSE
ncbi:MAG: hypothetical protein J6A01_05955, partial [Proteobacteria bacterium]|nr:hypothetical protein [Pseudomonadota bacterium]